MNNSYTVRKARREELEYLPAIERSAAQRFSSVPALEFLSRGDNLSVTELNRLWLSTGYRQVGAAGVWIVVNSSEKLSSENTPFNNIIGFLAAEIIDGVYLYIAELSIAHEHQGRGAGSLLLNDFLESIGSSMARLPAGETSELSLLQADIKGITLTTYPDLKFNGGFYEKLGFKEIDANQLGWTHVSKLEREREELGLEVEGWRRACMVRWNT